MHPFIKVHIIAEMEKEEEEAESLAFYCLFAIKSVSMILLQVNEMELNK
jgi:hypothetical protein